MNTTGEAWLDAVTRRVAAGAADEHDSTAWEVKEVDGQPVDKATLHGVVDRLERWDCVEVFRDFHRQPAKVVRGKRLAEILHIDGSLRDYFEGRTHNDQRSMNISGGQVGAAQFGDHASQTVSSQTFTHDERSQILGVIDGILGDVREQPGLSGLVEEVSGIREAVEADTARPKIKDRVGSALGTAITAGATHAVLQSMAHLQALVS